MVPCKVKGKKEPVDYPQFLVLWKGWPPESATWQWPAQRGVKGGIPLDVVAEYEAGIEAEAQLEAEEAAEDEEDDEDEDEDEDQDEDEDGDEDEDEDEDAGRSWETYLAITRPQRCT